ncbi:MAG: IS1595 family transposase [Pseudolabrys sp.]
MSIAAIYTDENAARAHLERLLWPEGPICPHCGNSDPERIHKLAGKSTRPGVFKCRECEKPFTVTVGTVMERSKIKLHQWVYATHLLTSSKKGISAHQIGRMLGLTYKSAWFLCHRIREAMRPAELTPMGGSGKTVEVDETLMGKQEGAPKRLKRGNQFRNIVLTLVERGGSARSFHIDGTTLGTLVPILRMNVNRESTLMTDEANWYRAPGREYANHLSVNHAAQEYAVGEITTNTVEGYFSIFKRGMKGVYQHCAERHLHRYLSEFDFRYSHRVALGYDDAARAAKALEGAKGKRLTYRRPN